MPNIVEAHKLVKQYPGSSEPAVRGVSFAIRQGEIFGFLGPNGARRVQKPHPTENMAKKVANRSQLIPRRVFENGELREFN